MEGQSHNAKESEGILSPGKTTSMSTLIVWNIAKVLEKKPDIDLKRAIQVTQERLNRDSHDVTSIISQYCEERHLTCALLAWQQLGHSDADSLYRFIEEKKNNNELLTKKETPVCMKSSDHKGPKSPTHFHCSSFDSNSMGPVVKLPVEPKTIMRLDYSQNSRPTIKVKTENKKDLTNKIENACCLDSECVERLAELDSVTKELRSRAGKLARREAERVELLERAEAAWTDLESGFQRRLTLSKEKEEDITKQIQKLIEDRNEFKNTCLLVVKELKNKSDAAEKDRNRLKEKEKELCCCACTRLRLSEESARIDSALAEQQCKVTSLERDLQFKEEQTSRKVSTLEGEVESARTLTHEAERALRAELGAIKEQIKQVSVQLLDEDSKTNAIKSELERLREEKMEMVEDLDGCKVLCDGRMQAKVDELMNKREELSELKNKVMECRCHLPVDAAVQVKRTPSLAALCRCTPEDKILDSCSCTSLRSQLLSNLLSDLFGGLQSELGSNGSQMPCKLLKCLEDNHNWDRASIVKSNLRSYFAQLLMGELDIAIATSIENYHAKWVGASCADVAKLTPSPGEMEDDGWQERALERRAQKLATKLAEQLFQDKADELAQRVRDNVNSDSLPCDCKPDPAVYQCLVKPPQTGSRITSKDTSTTAYWRRTQQDVTQLRVQIEDLKKVSIKKEDLKLMEDKITKIVKRTSGPDSMKTAVPTEQIKHIEEKIKKENKSHKIADQDYKNIMNDKQNRIKTKQKEKNINQKKGNKYSSNPNESVEKSSKTFKNRGQTFAVNMCLCSQKGSKKLTLHENNLQSVQKNERKTFWNQKPENNDVSQLSSIKQTKPITSCLPSQELCNLDNSKLFVETLCKSNCTCFNKTPSNTSIDKLLDTLTKWKCDLVEPSREYKTIQKDQMVSKISLYDGNILKPIKSPQNNPQITDNNLKCSRTSLNVSGKNKKVSEEFFDSYNQMEGEISKSAESDRPILASKEEIYMGEINLDKSNEIPCIKNTRQNKYELNEISYNLKYPHKSNNLEEYNYVKTFNSIANQDQLQNKKGSVSKEIRVLQNNPDSELSNAKRHEYVLDDANQTKIKKLVQTELFPCGCDYYINFLGVTLSNTISDKLLKSCDVIYDNLPHVKNCYKNRSNNLRPKNNKNIECNCVNKQRADYNIINEDKALDIQSFKEILENKECVCCEKDESKDLELNTFHLLEEHLKGKLEKFKQTRCKSSCIPLDEEKKLFSSILQKVKHLITESSNTVACKCSQGMQSKGSWNRAYGLLQEYLKIKIKRVQCSCVSSKENKNVILPDILDKVCTMIEKDFQRLQSICTCYTNSDVNKSVHKENGTILEEPVKDLDGNSANFICDPNVVTVCNYTHDKTIDKVSKQISNSIILTQNISSQMSNNRRMETKSCDAIKNDTKYIQTIDTSLKKSVKSSQYSRVKYEECDCFSGTSIKNKSSRFKLLENPMVLSNYCIDLPIKKDYCGTKINKSKIIKTSPSCPFFNNFEYSAPILTTEQNNIKRKEAITILDDGNKNQLDVPKNNLPYLGYTINCSCDGKLGTCICTKSIVLTDNDKNSKLWKTLIADSARSCDVSYIMKGPKNADEKNNEKSSTHNMKAHSLNENTECETDKCTIREEGLVLKDYVKRISMTHNTTNTYDESLSTYTNYNEDPIDWYDCGSQIHNKYQTNDIESSNFPTRCNHKKQTKSEVIMHSDEIKSNSLSSNCDCNMVPLCHVKMLVENIENKLMHSQCTCDALTSKVCPIHSKAIY